MSVYVHLLMVEEIENHIREIEEDMKMHEDLLSVEPLLINCSEEDIMNFSEFLKYKVEQHLLHLNKSHEEFQHHHNEESKKNKKSSRGSKFSNLLKRLRIRRNK